ncbi:putative hydrophobic domain protein [Methanoculleus chikugoensis]|uniref:Putative hydrophobic domain protein n=1 Tax=Methanoculleus chikugoensis TaxID=118126 RepID=A0A1M4ML16_9EURY|nr:TIGR00341 family protein [Methanoculleus chikugoensis]MDD4566372.1 TIGR00341 family protein [Methanoculleus chikugoensis]SCL75599.1 putative hydrophobic domain protein [Methanoculleus chikugoensis]
MKKIVVHVREDGHERVEEVLEGLHYTVSLVQNVYQITIYTPDENLDELIEKIQSVLDLRYNENMIEVSAPEFVISSLLKRAEKKAEEKEEKTPVEKLVDQVKGYGELDLEKLALTSIAGLVALSGLLLDNQTIIIGAMLLSPIMGPIYGFSVYAALGDIQNATRCLGVLAALLLGVFILSAVASFLINLVIPLTMTEEIATRLVLNPIYSLMAVFLGFAAALAFSRGTTEVIAGVAIAAAIIPPTVVAGLVLVLQPMSLIVSGVLVAGQIVGLIAGALVAVVLMKIEPRAPQDKAAARRYRIGSIVTTVILFTLLLWITALM